MSIDYYSLNDSVNIISKDFLKNIINIYGLEMPKEKLELLNALLKKDFINVNDYSEDDLSFFGEYSNIPTAHGGKVKGDGNIYIYPYKFSDKNKSSNLAAYRIIKNDLLAHEIFHYVISISSYHVSEDKLNLFLKENNFEDKEKAIKGLSHFMSEGFVQLYADDYALKSGLEKPKSNYNQNMEFVKNILMSMKEPSASIAFNLDYIDILNKAKEDSNIDFVDKYINLMDDNYKLKVIIEEVKRDLGSEFDTSNQFNKLVILNRDDRINYIKNFIVKNSNNKEKLMNLLNEYDNNEYKKTK